MRIGELVEVAFHGGDNEVITTQQIIEVLTSSQVSVGKGLVAVLKEYIFGQNVNPRNKIICLNILNATILDYGGLEYLTYVEKSFLGKLEKLAMYNKESQDENRGHSMFGPLSVTEQQQSDSAEFLRRLLIYIQAWAMRFKTKPNGQPTEFAKTYVKLVKKGVTFPTDTSIQPPVSNQSQPQSPVQNITGLVQSTEGTVHLLNEMLSTGDTQSEAVRELLQELKSSQRQITLAIDQSMQRNDQDQLSILLQLNGEVQMVLDSYSTLQPIQQSPPRRQQRRGDDDQLRASLMELQLSNTSAEDQIEYLRQENAQLQQAILKIGRQGSRRSGAKEEIQKIKEEIRQYKKENEKLAQALQPYQKSNQYLGYVPDEDQPSIQVPQMSAPIVPPSPQQSNLEIHNEQSFKACCLTDRGILYEDNSVQIGILIEITGDQGTGKLYIGNKSIIPITSITTDVKDFPSEGIKVTISRKSENQLSCKQGEQINRILHFQVTDVYSSIPQLEVGIGQEISRTNQGSLQLKLKLPVTIGRFMQPLSKSPREIFQEYNDLSRSETTNIINQLDPNINTKQLLIDFISFNKNATVLTNTELPDVLNSATIISALHWKMTSVFLLVEMQSASSATLKVRSSSLKIRQILATLVKSILTQTQNGRIALNLRHV